MMKQISIILLVLGLGLGLTLALPSSASAVVELGAGFGITSFDDDLDDVDTGSGFGAEANIGTGAMRLMFSIQSSEHDSADYSAWGIGPSWTLDFEGFNSRIYALISSHEIESVEGWGVTLGGGVGWPILPSSSLGLDFHLGQWEDGRIDARTGTIQVMFRIEF